MTSPRAANGQGSPDASTLAAELRAVQAHLSRLEARFRATIDQLPIGIVHADTDDRITRFNSAFCSMLGFNAEELPGKPFAEITYPDDVQGSAAALQRLWRGEVSHYAIEKRYVRKNGTILWARVTVAPLRDPDQTLEGAVGMLEDITERKAAETEVERVHQQLMLASRQAGMAEVATNVLHNVGNVLNSVNVSANLLQQQIRASKVDAFARSATLLQDHAPQLAEFLSHDERGQQLPRFLSLLAKHMLANQRATLDELASLTHNIEHVNAIVAAQQTYAKRCGVIDTVEVTTLIEDSLAMSRRAFERHGVVVIRDFESVPAITVDKHKVLQILVNLQRNAKQACETRGPGQKRVTVRVATCPQGVQIQVIDNGIGIAPERLSSLFLHGFTTRTDGHGFGLHGAALAASEMGATLEAASAGSGHGATFTLTLPLNSP